jgi:hypothetical protein
VGLRDGEAIGRCRPDDVVHFIFGECPVWMEAADRGDQSCPSAVGQSRLLAPTCNDPDSGLSKTWLQTSMDDADRCTLANLSAFLVRLDDARVAYQLGNVRGGAVKVQIVVPGER